MEPNREDGFLVRVIPTKTGLPDTETAEDLESAKETAVRIYKGRHKKGVSYAHIYSDGKRVFRAQIKKGNLKEIST